MVDFVSPLVNLLVSSCDSMGEKVDDVVNLNNRICSLVTALTELKAQRDDFKQQIERAQLDGLSCTSQVQAWLARAQVAETRAASVVHNHEQRTRCFGNCYSKYKLSKKVSNILEEATQLIERASDIKVAGVLHRDTVVEIPTRPRVGLHVMLNQVLEFLADDEVGIIGIYGMGGVGKTTLLKNINNEFLTKSHNYDVVIWVLVSKDYAAGNIQQVIGARLGVFWEETESQEQRASKIYRMMRVKKFLLLLDDVWEGIDLEKVGIPFPDKKNMCKVLFTTRSMDVCSAMDAHRKLKVEFLPQQESWQLFFDKVGRKEILESPTIRPLAENLVRKCGGLPLALITIGRAMSNKETEEEWMHAIEVLNRSPSELRGMEDVFTLLKFSYDYLENDLLRACFLYCSLFPEDCSVEKEQLIEYWIGEGFLDCSHHMNGYNKGHDIIGSLKVACLLEAGDEEKTQVKMHDVVRSFALWIASERGTNKNMILVEASMGLTEAPRTEKWTGALVISLLDNGIKLLPDKPVCLSLYTLLLQLNWGLHRISDGFFRYMPVLRVLDLSFTSLKELPASIKYLVELCHLDLSGTKITELPKELGSLAKLKLLDLRRTLSLVTVPHSAISGLTKLEVLNLYYSYDGWELNNFEGESEVSFEDLECLENLITLGITVTSLNVLKKLHDLPTLLTCIHYLHIRDCGGLLNLEFSSNSNHGRGLRRLSIKNCNDLEYMAVGAGSGSHWLPGLEVLALHDLPNLTEVWRNPVSQECLNNLRFVNIWRCHKLKNISWVVQLPKLEVIYLFYCKEIEKVVGEEGIADFKAFQSLRTLSIRDLPELTSIIGSTFYFPSLQSIAVIDCPKLNKLPVKASRGSTAPTVYGNKEWWNGLEWDEGITESTSFLPSFVSI